MEQGGYYDQMRIRHSHDWTLETMAVALIVFIAIAFFSLFDSQVSVSLAYMQNMLQSHPS